MRTINVSTAVAVVAMCTVWLPGCGKGTALPPAADTVAAAHTHVHDHEHAHGPHEGHIIELDSEDYHAELTYDEDTHLVGIHLLGSDAVTAAPIEAASVEIYTSVDGKTSQYSLPVVSQPDEPAGKSSYFELESEPLGTIVSGDSPTSDCRVRLSVSIDGLPYTGTIDTGLDSHDDDHHHHHSSMSAEVSGVDDVLVWKNEISEQGYEIRLGHHGTVLLAGAEVEPAVNVARDGQPVADAKVFISLLAADGETVLAKEVATVYEPPTDDEPAHYAQGGLKIPPRTREAILRYRVVFPSGKGERIIEVPVAVQ